MDHDLDNEYKDIVEKVWAKVGKPSPDCKVAHCLYYGWNDGGYERSRVNVTVDDEIVQSLFIMRKDEEATVIIGPKEERITVELPKKVNVHKELSDP